jgi:SAM-dependent methyltransferase
VAGKFLYDEPFYESQAGNSYISAKKILKLFTEYFFTPNSVIDVGCGTGAWLKVFHDLGAKDIHGVDGNEIENKFLYVPRENIEIQDLDNITKTDDIKYDLAMSLETGEHLQHETINNFVGYLANSSDIVMFSAAIPGQNGYFHINEQPYTYWLYLFKNYGFECFDAMRPLFLINSQDIEDVDWWYLQNILIFARNDKIQFMKDKGFKPTRKPLNINVADK